MKVLFIYNYNYIEPIGLMYLSSSLKRAGHETFFYDIALSTGLERYVDAVRPDIIAYSIVTGTHTFYAEINSRLKKRFSFLAVFGGPHATFYPDFIEEGGVDAICRGEGEGAMVELADRLQRGEQVHDIQNLWVDAGGIVHKNPLRPLEPSLDALPLPDRELLYTYPVYRLRSNKYILTSRGCPFDCTYCFNHSLKKLYEGKGTFCRKRSIGGVLQEIDELCRMAPAKTLQFFDDVFILDKQWVLDFCREYRKEVGLPFICYVRVNLVDEDIIAALKSAGAVTITFAVETANNHLRNTVLKRNITDEQIFSTVALLQKYDIPYFIQNMIGLPGETINDALDTMRLNIGCKPSFAVASLFQPYPGTELTDYAVEKGFCEESLDINHQSFYEKSVLKLENKHLFENCAWLFPLAILMPRLASFVSCIIKIPAGPIYKIIWHLSRCWGYFFRIYWISPRDVIRYVLRRKRQGGSPFVEK